MQQRSTVNPNAAGQFTEILNKHSNKIAASTLQKKSNVYNGCI